ncbi:hypothetical protein FIBSPDRAFT_463176 [Athelia psychrophila]|uniref:Uncharacterized protein n=1 Tax=Athelia psychrophila TaxID=1759441 RepID=A0A166LP08_9AGAM|nr:hypothetical protein FIBSPDRAFT_463176 [Fibularhizoctonia sp. CBS 109695]
MESAPTRNTVLCLAGLPTQHGFSAKQPEMSFLGIGVGMVGVGAMLYAVWDQYSNDKAQVQRPPSTRDTDVHVSRRHPGSDRAVRLAFTAYKYVTWTFQIPIIRVYPVRISALLRA